MAESGSATTTAGVKQQATVLLCKVIRAYKMYVNISHAWFLNYRACKGVGPPTLDREFESNLAAFTFGNKVMLVGHDHALRALFLRPTGGHIRVGIFWI